MRKRKLIGYLFFLLSLAFILTACSGGGGGGPSDSVAPSVTSTSPADGTAGVATDSVITATFSERMDASTIIAGTFIVSGGGSNLAGTVTYDSGTMTATFTPSESFALVTSYTATITTGVRDVAGNALNAGYTWSFTSRDGAWGTASPIETGDSGDGSGAQIAIDSTGNGLLVWEGYDGTRINIWANRYVPGTGWDTPAPIETDDSGSAYTPQVAVDSSGNAIAVWYQSDGTRYNIWANRFN